MTLYLILATWGLVLAGLYLVTRTLSTRRRSRERMFAEEEQEAPATFRMDENSAWLTQWLFRAGFRRPGATAGFGACLAVAVSVGGLLALAVLLSDVTGSARRALENLPGGLADICLPFVYLAPWTVLAIVSSLPILLVRAGRRRRVTEVEQDLPLVLEMLATLGEGGLGFDAALERILQAQPPERALTQELRIFQMEILAGQPRIQCLRRLSWRVEVMSLTVFVSALVQTEQVGAGVAGVLRRQADDLRGRRRENALALAAALPTKLMFPLVICFLPGILVATLGPTFYQIFQFIDNLTRSRGMP